MISINTTTARTLAIAGILSASMMSAAATATAQTPEVMGCASVGTPAAMQGMDHGHMHESTPAGMAGMDHGDMHQSTPATMSGMDHGHGDDMSMAGMHDVEFDLMYIDMMIPHHASIIALAEVAQNELTHPDLIAMAEDIIATQDSEILELQQLRGDWYGDAEPVSMDAMHGMPGMSGDMAAMEQQMSAEWQVQAFCAAGNKDLAFVEQVIPHHQMAIDTSEAALEEAEHQEIKDIAQDVIDAQQAEIDALEEIRRELQATPEA